MAFGCLYGHLCFCSLKVRHILPNFSPAAAFFLPLGLLLFPLAQKNMLISWHNRTKTALWVCREASFARLMCDREVCIQNVHRGCPCWLITNYSIAFSLILSSRTHFFSFLGSDGHQRSHQREDRMRWGEAVFHPLLPVCPISLLRYSTPSPSRPPFLP